MEKRAPVRGGSPSDLSCALPLALADLWSASSLAISLFGLGIAAVGAVIWLFLTGERYGRPAKPDKGVGFVQDRLDADRRLASLAPKMMLLANSEAADAELWRRFCTASSLAEDDPAAAREELRALEDAVDETLERSAGEGR